MMEEDLPVGRAFQPASDSSTAERVQRFLMAQGWAALSMGEHLRRLTSRGVRPEEVLWWVPGRADEVRAAALLHAGMLGMLLCSAAEAPAAWELLQANRAQIDRLAVREGAVDLSDLREFTLYPRELTVAANLLTPTGSLPPARPAGPEDVEQIYQVYATVSWMSLDSPQAWRDRLATQRCWVAELDGRVVAAARWTMSFGRWVEVGGVATHPDFRRRQAGSAVTLAAAGAALAEGVNVALRYGEPALASLYHPLGFEHVGRELVFYRRS